jgi:hypothetical protein
LCHVAGAGSVDEEWSTHRGGEDWEHPRAILDIVELAFRSRVVEWRGPSPYYFVPVPDEESADIREVAAIATYGWGVIPVEARIGATTFETSLFPKDGGYLLPLKDAVRKSHCISAGDDVSVRITVRLKS